MPIPMWMAVIELAREWHVHPKSLLDDDATWLIRGLTVQRLRAGITRREL